MAGSGGRARPASGLAGRGRFSCVPPGNYAGQLGPRRMCASDGRCSPPSCVYPDNRLRCSAAAPQRAPCVVLWMGSGGFVGLLPRGAPAARCGLAGAKAMRSNRSSAWYATQCSATAFAVPGGSSAREPLRATRGRGSAPSGGDCATEAVVRFWRGAAGWKDSVRVVRGCADADRRAEAARRGQGSRAEGPLRQDGGRAARAASACAARGGDWLRHWGVRRLRVRPAPATRALPPPPSCTKWTRLVLLPVLSGHVSSFSPY